VRTPRPHTGGSLTRHDTFRAPRARWSAWVTRLRGSLGHAVTRCVWSRGYAVRLVTRLRGLAGTRWSADASSAHWQPNQTRHLQSTASPMERPGHAGTRARGAFGHAVTRARGLAVECGRLVRTLSA